MLEVKNLRKTYKGKKGNDVEALKGIDIRFPSFGMVFVLGKSGSGKSTLLNLLGGLDKPSQGEIIVNGNPIASFTPKDLDEYRNAHVGFVFQEYNVLDDMTIEENVELALRLQSQKKNKEKVESVLARVGLEGMGKRKANALSGGQRQRVAIARAIVKDPDIVLADEPTGALDSSTGSEILSVLKELSKEKLVVVVSHDREYAMRFGDRIIEIADGVIVKDTSGDSLQQAQGNLTLTEDGSICIEDCAAIDEEAERRIIESIRAHKGKAAISFGEAASPHFASIVKSQAPISEPIETRQGETEVRTEPKKRSSLPFWTAFKMGAASLKKKPARASLMILLLSISLSMLGVASSLMLYDAKFSIAETMKGRKADCETIQKTYDVKATMRTTMALTGTLAYENEAVNPVSTYFTISEMAALNQKEGGNKFAGVYSWGTPIWYAEAPQQTSYYRPGFYGITDAGAEFMTANGFKLQGGNYPQNANEIAISRYQFDCYIHGKRYPKKVDDIIGTEVNFHVNGKNKALKIAGVYNCGEIPRRYDSLTFGGVSPDPALLADFNDYITRSFHRLAYVTPSFFEENGFSIVKRPMSSIGLSANLGANYYFGYSGAKYGGNMFIPAEKINELGVSLVYKDVSGNPTEYVAPKGKEVYLPSGYPNLAKGVVAGHFVDRAEYSIVQKGYSPAIQEKLPDEKAVEEANAAITRMRAYSNETTSGSTPTPYQGDFEADYALIKELGGPLYDDVYRFLYLISKSQEFIASYERETPSSSYEEGYLSFREKVNKANEMTEGYLDDATKTSIKDYLVAHMGNHLRYEETLRIAKAIVNGTPIGMSEASRSRFLPDAKLIVETPSLVKAEKGKELYDAIVDYGLVSVSEYGIMGGFGFDYEGIVTPIEENPPFMAHSRGSSAKTELKVIGYFEANDPKIALGAIGPIAAVEGMKSIALGPHIQYHSEITDYEMEDDVRYDSLMAKTDFNRHDVDTMLADYGTYRYQMTNSAYTSSKQVTDSIQKLRIIFLSVGAGFAVFAMLMLLHFVSNSVATKTKQIGILRAVGAKGSDLFRIFFSESGLLLLFTLAVSVAFCLLGAWGLNMMFLSSIRVVVIEFGIVNAAILLGMGLIFAFIGTFFPVLKAARKAPIDTIREQ